MIKRPVSVTVISWFLITIAGIGLLAPLPMNPLLWKQIAKFSSHEQLKYSIYFIGPVLAGISGLFMLKGYSWARWLYVLWFGYTNIWNVLEPVRLIGPGLVFGVVAAFLFSRGATAFFDAHNINHPRLKV